MSMQEKVEFPSLSRYVEIKQNAYHFFPLFRRLSLISEKEQMEYIGSIEVPFRDPIERQIFVNTLMMPNDLYFSKETSGKLITEQKQLAMLHRVTMADIRFKKIELDHYRLRDLIEDELTTEKRIFSKREAGQDYPECYYQRNMHVTMEQPICGNVSNFMENFPSDDLSLKKVSSPQAQVLQMSACLPKDEIQLYFPGKRIPQGASFDHRKEKNGKVH